MIFSTAARGRTAFLSTLSVVGLSACSSDNPTGEFLESSGLGPKVAPRADFVERSRPRSLNYMTIGTADPGRATAPRTPAEVKAAEAELDSDRDRNLARGTAAANLGGTPPPPPIATPAAAPKPANKPAPKTP
jgi:hypothetical protein